MTVERPGEAGGGASTSSRWSHVDLLVFTGFRFPPEAITLVVRWYLRYGLSYGDVDVALINEPAVAGGMPKRQAASANSGLKSCT